MLHLLNFADAEKATHDGLVSEKGGRSQGTTPTDGAAYTSGGPGWSTAQVLCILFLHSQVGHGRFDSSMAPFLYPFSCPKP